MSVNVGCFASSTLVAHGAYDWAARHDLHTVAKDDLITGDQFYCGLTLELDRLRSDFTLL